MSERDYNLTTGQMIDRLKVGDMAEAKYYKEYPSGTKVTVMFKIIRDEDGVRNLSNGDRVLRLGEYFFDAKWRMLNK